MSRTTVRSAIKTFFAPNNVTGLNTVYRTQPRVIDGAAFYPAGSSGAQSGAVGIVHIASEYERRVTGPAAGVTVGAGWKRVTYDCGLIILFRSTVADPGAGDVDPSETADRALDAVLEAAKARLRSDRTLGNAVFSAGEGGEAQNDDIRIDSDLPVLNGDVFEIWSVMRFTVSEWIQT